MYVHRSYIYRGESHIESGAECQDAALTFASGYGAGLALADGHGDPVHSRSALGARMATQAVRRVLSSGPLTDPAQACSDIMRLWCTALAQDIRKNGNISPAWPARPYGCTCLAAIVSDSGWNALQLGDGIIMVMDEDGNISGPVPDDPRCSGNLTTSMCSATANDWRHACFDTRARIIVLASDGLTNCFRDSQSCASAFLAGIDASCRESGIEATLAMAGEAVQRLAAENSRDDVSIAIAIDSDAYGS